MQTARLCGPFWQMRQESVVFRGHVTALCPSLRQRRHSFSFWMRRIRRLMVGKEVHRALGVKQTAQWTRPAFLEMFFRDGVFRNGFMFCCYLDRISVGADHRFRGAVV